MIKIIFYLFLFAVAVWAISWTYSCQSNEDDEKVCSFSGIINVTRAPDQIKDGYNDLVDKLSDDNADDDSSETASDDS